MRNLKPLVPALLLLAVYLVADTCLGPLVGLCVTAPLGAGEFLLSWIKNKRPVWTSLGAALFVVAVGTLSLAFEGTPLGKIRNPAMETVACLFLALLVRPKADLSALLPPSVKLSPDRARAMKRILRAFIFLLAAHALLAFASAFLLPLNVSAFVSGPLLYILVFLFFLVAMLKKRLLARVASRDEWLPVVDGQGRVVGKATRRQCHSGGMLLHPVVHLHILNTQGDIYLQRRSLKKKLLPGRWDTAVGGHVDFGEKIEDALKREACEELGIERFRARFLGSYLWESSLERELVFPFLCVHHSPIRPDNDEVSEGRFWTRTEIENPANAPLLTPQFLHEYHRLLRHLPKPPSSPA